VLCAGITYYVACLCLLSNKLKKIVHTWLNLFPRLKAEFRKIVYENNMTPAALKASKQQASLETQ
jgi:hypothetical protein